MMEDLLDRIKGNLQIPEEEVVLVVRLDIDGVLSLLLDLKRSNVQITEEVVETAAAESEKNNENPS